MKVDKKLANQIEKVVKDARLYEFHKSFESFLPALVGIVNRYDSRVDKCGSLDYSLEEMQDMALAFFEDFNPELAERVRKSLEKAQIRATEPCLENEGENNAVGVHDGRLEVELNPTNDVRGLCTIAHEFAHTGSQRSAEKVKEKEQIIGEIESKFIEKVYADWLLANEAISQEDYDFKLKAQRQDLVTDCNIILEENFFLKLLKNDFSEEHIEDVILSTYPKRMEECVKRIKKGKIAPWIGRYVVGEIVAQIIYNEFCQAPEDVSARFTEYMKHNAELSFEEALKFLIGENYVEKVNNEFFPKKLQNQQE